MARIDRPRTVVTPSPTSPTGAATPAPAVSTTPSAPTSPGGAGASTFAGTSTGPVARPLTADVAGTKKALEAYFAPYDQPIEKEVGLIRDVIAARKTDPRTFVDGDNPYAITYAVYNLRNPDVIKALIEAHQSGVDVQILIEDSQLDPAKTWNTADEELVAAGFEFKASHKGLTPDEKRALDLIGIEGSGLMHLKTRIFSYPDPQTGKSVDTVISGSMNPGDEALFNDETFHIIRDPVLIERYKAKVAAVRDDRDIENTWSEGAAVNVLFTPATSGANPADKILELVDKEKEAIFMTVFSLRNIKSKTHRDGLIEKLKAAKARGVEIAILTDKKQSDGVDASGARIAWDDKTEDLLKAAGIPVFECINEGSPFTAMHQKSAIFGLTAPKVVTDCGNWTAAALGDDRKRATNDESLLFIDSNKLDDGATARRYLSNFLHLMRTYDHQQGDDTPDAERLVERFTALPGWPKVKVDFDVVAKTQWGQEVYITGDHPALGDWTREGPGIRLNTTGGKYPLWSSDTSIELPFGLALELKIVKRDPSGALVWEPGDNQLLIVDSGNLNAGGAPDDGAQHATTRFRGD